jgi:hypothetical protein
LVLVIACGLLKELGQLLGEGHTVHLGLLFLLCRLSRTGRRPFGW